MTLRIMLLGLVASMGIELPSDADVSSWTRSGREWVNSQLVDLSGSRVEAEPACAETTDCRQASTPTGSPVAVIAEDSTDAADLAFEAASTAMAADFAADLRTMRAESPTIEDAPLAVATVEAPAVGLPEGEESMTRTAEADEVEAVEADAEAVEPDESPSRLDRVSSAVRLTREAVQAWATLMQESAEDDCSAR